MPASIPPLNLSASDKSQALGYASAGPISTGAFTVSFGGNANAAPTSSGGSMKWALIAIGAWWVYRHRRG